MKRFLGLLALTGTLFGTSLVVAQAPGDKDAQPPKDKAKAALSINDPKAFQGYTLISPMLGTKTYLVDMQGRIVRTWEGAASPELCAYLLPNGNLLRPCAKDKGGTVGVGGRIQEFTFDGDLVWDYKFPTDQYLPHHDITKLPNGNVLVIAYEKKTGQEAAAAGRKGDAALEIDGILEIQPKGKDGGEIVWQWSVWHHLIQDNDDKKANFGKVAEHPELVDINVAGTMAALTGQAKGGGKGIGGFGGFGGGVPGGGWTHINGLAYNVELDQIMLSIHGFSEFWIIDHGTTTAQAASHSGGKQGKGGDLLYRWGNPQNYRAGQAADEKLFHQHNAHWIAKGLPGEGHILVFNNGLNRPDGAYSSVDEIILPVNKKGGYAHKPGTAFGPENAAWSYTAPKKSDFFSNIISGAQRLPNGNTLICAGTTGTVFEVTTKEEVVWKYTSPASGLAAFGGVDLKDLLKKFNPKKGDPKDSDPKKGAGPQPPAPGGGMGGLGMLGGSLMFRAYRYGPDYPGLADRKLMPGLTIEETMQKQKAK